jgi:hypothetical protein
MRLRRRNTLTGVAYWVDVKNLRDAGRQVAYCAADNLAYSRSEATEMGMRAESAFEKGELFTLDRYSFSLESQN